MITSYQSPAYNNNAATMIFTWPSLVVRHPHNLNDQAIVDTNNNELYVGK